MTQVKWPVFDHQLAVSRIGSLSADAMKVVQIGCGTIGFAYACALKSSGVQVTVLEKSHQVIRQHLDSCDIFHIDDAGVEFLRDVSAIFLAVPTPQSAGRLDFQSLADTLPTVRRIVSANPRAIVVLRRSALSPLRSSLAFFVCLRVRGAASGTAVASHRHSAVSSCKRL